MRTSIHFEYQRTCLYAMLTAGGLYLSYGAMAEFSIKVERMSDLGFADVTSLRRLFDFLSPEGMFVGDWVSVFLILLPFPLILSISLKSVPAKILTMAALLPFVATILLTLSRGMYIALASFCAVVVLAAHAYGICTWRRSFLTCTVVLSAAVAIVVTIGAGKPLLKTAEMVNTRSHLRSLAGRSNVWSNSMTIGSDHLMLGIGADNLPNYFSSFEARGGDSIFVGRAYNILLQIFVERGILGLVLYAGFATSYFYIAHRRLTASHIAPLKRMSVVILSAGFLSLLVRDIGYSSLLSNPAVQSITALIFAIQHRDE